MKDFKPGWVSLCSSVIYFPLKESHGYRMTFIIAHENRESEVGICEVPESLNLNTSSSQSRNVLPGVY